MPKQVGQALSHESARGHVTGSAKYVDDLAPHLAQLVHAWPVLSTHVHARVLGIDVHQALAQPGVCTVLRAEDVPGENDTGAVRHDEPLFPNVVQFHAQPIAWVLAETEEQARRAADKVVVTYEPLPAILSIDDAIAKDSFLTDAERISRGDAEHALSRSRRSLEGELRLNGQEHFYLETQAAIAWIDEADSVLVHSSTQHPSETQEVVARVLGMAKHQVIVQCVRMGGAFGGKEVQANIWAAVAALGAHKLKRPVRVRLSRAVDMAVTGKRHPFLARFRVGFEDNGRLDALSIALFSDGGYSLDLSAPIMMRAMFHVDNCYHVPNLQVVGRVCRTNHVSHTAFRGFGGPQGMVVIEEVLDRVARALHLPPHVVRERNFYNAGDLTHYGQPVRDATRIARIWHELKSSSQFEARASSIAKFNAEHAHVKRGLAITPVKFGISFTATFFNQAGAQVLIYKDGSVQVNHGGTEMGQGLHTKVQQIAADALGIPLASVRVMPTRTDKIPNTSATAASSGSDLNGAAVWNACETLRDRLAEFASQRFHAPRSAVSFQDGQVVCNARHVETLSFPDLVSEAYLARIPLFASGFYRTPDIQYDAKAGRGKPFHYFAYGAAVSEVEVDGFTGQYKLLRVDILHDVGSSLSPLVDRGQIEGGFMQGVGWLTCEELFFDEGGVLKSQGASTYKLPSTGECPAEFRVALLERAAEPGVIHGSKAVGEPPFMLAISVREALRAAAGAFGGSGPIDLACPATAEAVFWAVERARARSV